MRHAILTCKNHPNLRWTCKEIAVTPTGNEGLGSYNGSRNLFFGGEPTGERYVDGSGMQPRIVEECDCPASDLILAPEDSGIWEEWA